MTPERKTRDFSWSKAVIIGNALNLINICQLEQGLFLKANMITNLSHSIAISETTTIIVIPNHFGLVDIYSRVEVDEEKLCRQKFNVGRVIDGQWVVGGICRETKDVFFVPCPDNKRNSICLIDIISRNRICGGKLNDRYRTLIHVRMEAFFIIFASSSGGKNILLILRSQCWCF
ncbi:hypothetical protein RF11_00315 [Thelohanellus kitauei]|uniref:Uncharacterized protein n=1 Tax=Thelohanellus kitauei TaxID=669202 RepID=A0A0C2M4B5_THEKT|nr:hypothetical protein RF11_00315 [Thelohanellus kitauei]